MESIILSETDKAILESYKTTCRGLAQYLGNGYEFVIHSLENLDHSVIEIINGFHTGRTVGAPITDLALMMLNQIRQNENQPAITYFTHNKQGKPLKATTITIYGENQRIIGLLCINFYLDTPFSSIIKSFSENETPQNGDGAVTERFSETSDELIQNAFEVAVDSVSKNTSIPAKNRNKEIITILYNNGIFQLKDSVLEIANRLNISKNTVYLHIRNLKEEKESDPV